MRTTATLAPLLPLALWGCVNAPVVEPPGNTDPIVIVEGDLVISEVMVRPTTCDAAQGQWVELHNTRADTVSLDGLRIGNGAEAALITGGTSMEAGAFAVGAPSNIVPCHGFTPDFTFAPLALATADDARVELLSQNGRVDQVIYGPWGAPAGASLSLDPAALTATSNDGEASWCASNRPLGETSDRGTPGRRNPRCDEGDTGQPDDTDPTSGPLTVDELAAGDLVITELMVVPDGCTPATSQYIEVFNASGRSVDLDGLLLSNGTSTTPIVPGPVLTPGTSFWAAIGTPGSSCWTTYLLPDAFWDASVTFSQASVVSLGAGTDTITTVLDSVDVGRIDLDTGASAQLSSTSFNADANDRGYNWCPSQLPAVPQSGTFLERGTPGLPNAACALVDTGLGPPLTGTDLTAGDLIITELMVAPDACSDSEAEYIEIYNASGSDVDLQGLEIYVAGQRNTLTRSYPVAADSFAIAEFWSGATAGNCYAGLTDDFLWDSAVMDDAGTTVELRNPNGVVDVVDLIGWATESGASLQLDPASTDATANDDPANWCHADNTFLGSQGDRGSPKAANPACSDSVVDTAPPVPTADTAPVIEDRDITQLAEGDLVITEAHVNPVGCPDWNGEWFEVYNNTPYRVNLQYLEVVVEGVPTTLTQPTYSLDPGEYGLAEFQSRSNPASCFPGLIHDMLWTGQEMNDAGSLLSLRYGFVVFDSVDITGLATTPGATLQLTGTALDATANDDPANWCHATITWPGSFGDFGSPKAPNETCVVAGSDTSDTDDTFSGPDVRTVGQLVPGDLIITEIMTNPADCLDRGAEYIELYNNTDDIIDPTGLVVGVGGGLTGNTLILANPIGPGDYAQARFTTGSSPACYAVADDLLHTSGPMDNGGTIVRIQDGAGTILDLVNTTGWSIIREGASIELDPTALSATANDSASNWCVSTTLLPAASTDRGSAGSANAPCTTSTLPDTGDTFVDTSVP